MANDVLFNNILPTAMIYAISHGFAKEPWEDPEGWIETLFNQNFGGWFGANILSTVAVNYAMDESRKKRGLKPKPAWVNFGSTPLGTVSELGEAITERNWKKVAELSSAVGGVPGTGAGARAVKGYNKFIETKDPRYLLWSEYSMTPVEEDPAAAYQKVYQEYLDSKK